MEDEERYGVLIALREQQGWLYLGHGRWKKPDWMLEQERIMREAERGK